MAGIRNGVVTKASRIRDMLTDDPSLKNSQIIKALRDKKIIVTHAMVSNARNAGITEGKTKGKKGKKGKKQVSKTDNDFRVRALSVLELLLR